MKWEGEGRLRKEGRAVEMESKKRRMLDPRVIRGKETERGKRRESATGKEKREGWNQRKKTRLQ